MGGCGALDEDFGGGGEFGVVVIGVVNVAAVGLGEGCGVVVGVGEGRLSRGRIRSDGLPGWSWRGGSGGSASWWWALGSFPGAEGEASHEARSVV